MICKTKITIGLHGGLANNVYVLAKALYRQGVDTLFINESNDTFPFSQPIWEDTTFTLSYDKVQYGNWTPDAWQQYRERIGWQAPEFYLSDQPDKCTSSVTRFTEMCLFRGGLDYFLAKILLLRISRGDKYIMMKMQNADVLVVCGVNATLLAWLSGKPYVVWPHGGDIRFASGSGFKYSNFFGRGVVTELRRWLLKRAYSCALYIGSHDPKGIAGHLMKKTYGVEWFPIPHPNRVSLDSSTDKHLILSKMLKQLGVTLHQAKYYLFMPSRLDFYWKGSDRLFSAIQKVQPKNTCFIFAGWGQDYQRVWDEFSVTQHMCFLPFSVSKPILYELFTNVDMVIDQFLLGTYGTSAIEAMSCGTPVMMHIDEQAYQKMGWDSPPVINVSSVQEIASVLQRIDNSDFDFLSAIKLTTEWFRKTHLDEVAVPRIMQDLTNALANRNSKIYATQP